MMCIGLVACSKRKKSNPQKAMCLYNSTLFLKAKEYAIKTYDNWYILSAKHHLLHPDSVIEPYDEMMLEKSAVRKKEWANNVLNEIIQLFPSPNRHLFYFHAGVSYRKYLIHYLRDLGYVCKVPLRGLKIGEQLSWYRSRVV